MGKIEAEPQITHFSHPHLLNLKSINSSSAPNITKCSACKKQALGLVYSCESCSYTLHKICSEMPETLTHKADRRHALTLLPAPAYSGGAFKCNACGVVGTGFCYHCKECELDLHPACAFTRSSVKGGAHDHPLQLCFEPPYPNKAFLCDVCGGSGSNHWLYRCEPCGLDVHLKCAKADRIRFQQPKTDPKPQSSSRAVNNFPHPTPMFQQPQPFYVAAAPSFMQQQPTRNDAMQQVVNSVIEGLIEGAATQLGQALFQGALGN